MTIYPDWCESDGFGEGVRGTNAPPSRRVRTMAEKLLPCPFCGGTDVHLRHLASASMSWVSCVGCGLETPSETGVTDDAAVTYWNRRAAPPSSNLRVKPLQWIDGRADSIVGLYRVKLDNNGDWRAFLEGWTLYASKGVPSIFETEEAAKAGAQSDYTSRVHSALDQPSAPPSPQTRESGNNG